MKYNAFNRRLFLQGLGTTLALPVLPSLLSEFAKAQSIEIPPRFVHIFFPYGPVADATWYPSSLPTTSKYLSAAKAHSTKNVLSATAHYMHYGAIPSTGAGISSMFDSKFLAYKNKMSILRGICKNAKGGGAGHYGNVLLGDSTEAGKHSDYQRTPTIDQIMAYANGFYPSTTNITRSIYATIRPTHLPNEAMCWGFQNASARSGGIVQRPNDFNPSVLYSKLFGHMTSGGGGGGSAPAVEPVTRSATPIIDSVLEDFKSVRNGRAISSEDKALLDTHMDLMAQLEKNLRPPDSTPEPVPAACTKPSSPTSPYYTDTSATTTYSGFNNDWGKQAKAFNDLFIAAFQCGLTRVAVMNANFPLGWHIHDTQSNASQESYLFGHHKKVVDEVAYDLISKMDSITEANGKTMLDNSLVHLTGGSGEEDHSPFNYPTALWGSAGGQLTTGLYLDYRRRDRTNDGLLTSQLLCTIMRTMGLQPTDWNMKTLGLTGSKVPDSASGYGDYFNGSSYNNEATYYYPRLSAGDWLPVLKS